MCTAIPATGLLRFISTSRVTRYYAMPYFHTQNKPMGKTAIIVAKSRGVWDRVRAVPAHPAVKEAVLSEDSMFSQVQFLSHHVFQPCTTFALLSFGALYSPKQYIWLCVCRSACNGDAD